MKKRISVLGSTGSIGVNTLKGVDHLSAELEVIYLSAKSNSQLLIQQAKRYKPRAVAIVDHDAYLKVKKELSKSMVEVLKG